MRIKAVISYDGSRFEGFQSQKHTKNTVMGHLARALENLGVQSQIVGSGRTDKGVHATAQVIHFDLPKFWRLEKFQRHFSRSLGPFIQLRHIRIVDENFHARFSAKTRGYRYIFSQKKTTPFQNGYLLHISDLDTTAIASALKLFEGTHDFSYFMKTGSDTKSTVRTITKTVSYEYEELFVVYIEANGFLRAQVRMMVDFLIKISKKELTQKDLLAQLNKEARISTTLAPPNALYLCRVVY